ncbi:S8 family serine peptidase [Micromonospora sp. B11E3]|uniref:S8 family serine peptidase n=1 Tax=Micromonospora sp. B11E3 TaxID=3153562 RepID=UPI00325F8FBC
MRRTAVAGIALASVTSIVCATTAGAAMAEPTTTPAPQASPDPLGLDAANAVRPTLTAPARPQAREGVGAVVPGRYIVKLKNDKATPKATRSAVNALTKSNGGTVRKVFTSGLRGYSAQLTPAQAKRLAADPDVEYVQPVRRYKLDGSQSNPPSWGLDRIDQTTPKLGGTYNYPSASASDVTAYIIDTGIDINHEDFGGRASFGFNAVYDGITTDCNGHGTHVAGTVGGTRYGVAKDVNLVAVRVLDCDGSGTTEEVVAGIDFVTGQALSSDKPAVANMSLGGPTDLSLDDAVAASIAAGVTYTVSAGNEADDACAYSPARTSAAITVGATDRIDMKAGFSNYGSCLDIFAPGVGITSAYTGSTTATATLNGTSMAAPHVAGAAALLLAQNPSWTPQQVRNSIVTTGISGAVVGPTGSIDRLLHVGSAVITRSSVGLRARINDSLVVAQSGGSLPLLAKSWQLQTWEKFDVVSLGSGLIALKSKANGKYVVAESGGSKPLIARSSAVGTWEKFQLVNNTDGSVSLKSMANGKYVAADGAGSKPLIAKSSAVSTWERFELVDLGDGWIALRALVNNRYVTAQSGGSLPLLAKASSINAWEAYYVDWHHPDGTVHLYANANLKIVKADSGGSKPLIAKSTSVGSWEQFTIGIA